MHELVEKIVVHAPDKSSGHREQRVDIYFRFNVASATATLGHGNRGKKEKGCVVSYATFSKIRNTSLPPPSSAFRGKYLSNSKPAVLDNNVYRIALLQLVCEYLPRDKRFEIALHIALERTRAEARIVALVDN